MLAHLVRDVVADAVLVQAAGVSLDFCDEHGIAMFLDCEGCFLYEIDVLQVGRKLLTLGDEQISATLLLCEGEDAVLAIGE